MTNWSTITSVQLIHSNAGMGIGPVSCVAKSATIEFNVGSSVLNMTCVHPIHCSGKMDRCTRREEKPRFFWETFVELWQLRYLRSQFNYRQCNPSWYMACLWNRSILSKCLHKTIRINAIHTFAWPHRQMRWFNWSQESFIPLWNIACLIRSLWAIFKLLCYYTRHIFITINIYQIENSQQSYSSCACLHKRAYDAIEKVWRTVDVVSNIWSIQCRSMDVLSSSN